MNCIPVLVQTALMYPSCWCGRVRVKVDCGAGCGADAAEAAAAAGTCSSGDP